MCVQNTTRSGGSAAAYVPQTMPSMGSMRSPRREAASARKKRHQELAAERRQHKERAAEARKATAGGGAGALVAKFRRRVATFDKNRDFEHLDKAARDIFLRQMRRRPPRGRSQKPARRRRSPPR